MSSRLMPPKVGSSAATMSTKRSGSGSSTSMSKTSMPANFLNRTALPSITGLAASGPMLPSPSTAVPLVTTPTRLPRAVTLAASAGSADDRVAGGRDARRIGERQVALVAPAAWSRRPRAFRRGGAGDSPARLRRCGRRSWHTFGLLRPCGRFSGATEARSEKARCSTQRASRIGAVEKTRTSTVFPPQRPQRCASTSSATTAYLLRSPCQTGDKRSMAALLGRTA